MAVSMNVAVGVLDGTRRLLLRAAVILLCSHAIVLGSVWAGQEVLPPESAAHVATMLAVDEPLSGEHELRFQINSDRILVTAGPVETPVLAVAFVHQSQAPAGSTILGDLAVVLEPGPAPRDLVAELIGRVEQSPVRPVWVVPTGNDPVEQHDRPTQVPTGDPTTDEAQRDAPDGVHDVDQTDVPAHLDHRDGPTEFEVAAEEARHLIELGDRDGARSVLQPIVPGNAVEHTIKQFLLDEPITPDEFPQDLSRNEACELYSLVELALGSGRCDRAKILAEHLLDAAPLCTEVARAEINARVCLQDWFGTVRRTAEFVEAAPDERERLLFGAGIYRDSALPSLSITLLERAARTGVDATLLRDLTAPLVDDEARQEAHFRRFQARVSSDPTDSLARYGYGLILHYRDQFAESNEILRPLESEVPDMARLHVYLAMNDFNLGDREAALARLNAADQAGAEDPDIWYCRAEIVRDTDRSQAIADLEHYQSVSAQHRSFLPTGKHERVRSLLASLRHCVENEIAECDGRWEHPRAEYRNRELIRSVKIVVSVLTVVSLTVLAGLVLRRRSKNQQVGS